MENEKTHWLQSPNKNYIGHWDLPNGKDLTLTILSAQWEEVKNPITNTSESKRVIRWKENNYKPMICNQTNANSILKSTGEKFMEDSVGKKVTLFVDSIMDYRAGENVDCIRVRGTAIPTSLPAPSQKQFDKIKKAWETGEGKSVEEMSEHFTFTEDQLKWFDDQLK